MTHAALANAALFFFLVFMTLLLVTFIGAVIVAPPAAPTPARGEPAPLTVQALPRPTAQAPAPPPLPRRRPLGTARWSADADAASPDGAPMPAYSRVLRPKVSGGPPWGPAPKPPGADPWAAENPSPGWQLRPGAEPVSPDDGPPLGTPAPADDQARYPRHARGR